LKLLRIPLSSAFMPFPLPARQANVQAPTHYRPRESRGKDRSNVPWARNEGHHPAVLSDTATLLRLHARHPYPLPTPIDDVRTIDRQSGTMTMTQDESPKI
jgi:hypothetical protein